MTRKMNIWGKDPAALEVSNSVIHKESDIAAARQTGPTYSDREGGLSNRHSGLTKVTDTTAQLEIYAKIRMGSSHDWIQ